LQLLWSVRDVGEGILWKCYPKAVFKSTFKYNENEPPG